MSGARHVMILASAGSGKTHALTGRFIALLARGAAPERMVALTFTRKAAGEFFDEILNRLAAASRDPDAASLLASEIDRPGFGPAQFLPLLRSVIDAMPRLRLGTMDSFFARIVRAFPLELGLAGDFEILQDPAARIERRRVLQRLFMRPPGGLGEAQRNFIEEFKRATFGAEEKRLGERLDAFLDDHQQVYLDAPAAELWGNPDRIWPRGNPWLGMRPDPAAAARALGRWAGDRVPAGRQRDRWTGFLSALADWAPGAALPGGISYVLGKALDKWDELAAGCAELEFDRKRQELDASACAALSSLVRHIIGGEMERRLETTRGIHAVVRDYDQAYHQAVRRNGRLTFSDVQRLLQPVRLTSGGPRPGRLLIDFRLDGGIDHWLLDEFQDTSFGQWTILRNLIDEAVQDPEGRRTFFCVGDVKQAIFTWREGDPRLFREIFDHYNAASPGAVSERHLVRSWRSGPPVVDMINRVFGDGAVLGGLFPGETSASWNAAWRGHESAVPANGGHAALLHAGDKAGRWEACLRLLGEIRPLERGLTCAVLVQKNDAAAELADFLRREGGLPAVAESDLHVCTDNPPGSALLALVQAAAHPADRLAWEHVLMTPLGDILAEDDIADPSALSTRLLGRIHSRGFERTIGEWLSRLEPRLRPDDAFSRRRARQFAAAAGLFDQTGSRDAGEFIEFMKRHTVRDAESAAVIRVMTIHKSKGLGFDLVLLPDLEGQSIARMREGLAVRRTSDRSVDWVLDLPPKLFRRCDPVIEAYVRSEEAEAGYEKLSLLYVALTRAKRATYAIIEPAGRSQSANFPRLLSGTLGSVPQPVRVGGLALEGAWSAGDPDWHARLPPLPLPPPGPPKARLLDPAGIARAARLPARRPSAEGGGPVAAAALFAFDSGADFGATVHRLLAQVEWAADGRAGRLGAAWAAMGSAGEEALACLRAPELGEVWTAPSGGRPELWRERGFEIVLDGAWMSGIVDRVIVLRDSGGRALAAKVFDFKTERIGEGADPGAAAGRHAGQLNLYRRAVAVLAGLPAAAVGCEIVFTRLRRRAAVAAPATSGFTGHTAAPTV